MMATRADSPWKVVVAVVSTMVGTLAVVSIFLTFQTKADAAVQDEAQRRAWEAINANAIAIGVLDERTRDK